MRPILFTASLFIALASASTSLRGDSSSRLSQKYIKDDYDSSNKLLPSPSHVNIGAGSLSAWLEENIWDNALAANVEVFRLPTSGHHHHNDRSLQLEEGENTVPNPGEDLIVSVTFRDIYKVIFFIAVAWLLGTLSVYFGLPSLVGEIFAGFLLGPPLADFVPYPGALVLAGNLGLIGLILESGIGLDVAQLTEVGSRALFLAVVGSALPLVAGFAIGQWIGMDVKPSVAMGAAFAPSSLGVASAALSTGEVLNTPIGQLIVASSVFDDVFGLILLSIIEVFATPRPTAFDYILPFLSSFGYLIALGCLGITLLPKLLEKHILPLVSERNREQFAMMLMMLLMIAYMLALNYSGASYLTGVFLAGMTFSQVHSVHASFVKHGRPLLEWLLRIFFSATIGFQVPVTNFGDPYVVKWGFALLLPVFAKVPLGLLVPHFQREIPDDFPYNPYYRDVIVTALSMACRGEFNFVVASYALSEGLFLPDVYSAVIFAVLFGSIVCPLILSKVLRHYNEKSKEYLDGDHPIKRISGTCDGYRPLFLAIQARTPIHWSLQEAFERALAEKGLLIIDHRSWHTLGTGSEAVDITELFVQDTKVRVRVKNCFGGISNRSADQTGGRNNGDEHNNDMGIVDSIQTDVTPDSSTSFEDGLDEDEEIQARCAEIKEALTKCLGSDRPEDYAIQVSQWTAFIVDKKPKVDERESDAAKAMRRRFYSFHSFNEDTKEGDKPPEATSVVEDIIETSQPPRQQGTPSLFRRSSSLLQRCDSRPDELGDEPCLSGPDLWETDSACHDATREGFTLAPDCNGYGMRNIAEGLGADLNEPPLPARRAHSRAVSFDVAVLSTHATAERDLETKVIRDRLHGYVRHHPRPPNSG